jgi:hypothetical protein
MFCFVLHLMPGEQRNPEAEHEQGESKGTHGNIATFIL